MKYLVVFLMFLSFNTFAFDVCDAYTVGASIYDSRKPFKDAAKVLCKNGKPKAKYRKYLKAIEKRCRFFSSCDPQRAAILSLAAIADAEFKNRNPEIYARDQRDASGVYTEAQEKARKANREAYKLKLARETLAKAIQQDEYRLENADKDRQRLKEEISRKEELIRNEEDTEVKQIYQEQIANLRQKLKAIPDRKSLAERIAKRKTVKLRKSQAIDKATKSAKTAIDSVEETADQEAAARALGKEAEKLHKAAQQHILKRMRSDVKCKAANLTKTKDFDRCAQLSPEFAKFLKDERSNNLTLSQSLEKLDQNIKGKALMELLLKNEIKYKNLNPVYAREEAYEAMDRTLLGQYIDEKAMAAACAAKQSDLGCNIVEGDSEISNIESLKTAIEKQTQEVRKAKATKE